MFLNNDKGAGDVIYILEHFVHMLSECTQCKSYGKYIIVPRLEFIQNITLP